MGVEIERKFIVNKNQWFNLRKNLNGTPIKQGYLLNSNEKTVRIRIKGEKSYLCVKGPEINGQRTEYEYEIPFEEGNEMFQKFCPIFISKIRYEYEFESRLFEIDEFIYPNEGLILAEVELTSIDEAVIIPPWIDSEVTGNPDFYNSNMIATY